MVIKRDYYVNQVLAKRWNGKVKIITGLRRCGKSYLLSVLYKEVLLSEGIRESDIIEVSLEKRSNTKYRNPIALQDYILSNSSDPARKYYIFIDEIQMCLTVKNPDIDESIVTDKNDPSLYITFYDVLNDLKDITFSTNKDWTASSSASWATVTNNGQSSATSIIVTVEANYDYDDRTATITIQAGKLSKTVTVKQSTNIGLLVSNGEYVLSDVAQSIDVEISHNVEYDITIDDACNNWVSFADTKGLITDKVTFLIAKNESFTQRVGTVRVNQTDGSLY